ncbi:MAG: DUF3500 domain-containing protein [Pseudomonadota bacterium]
MDRRTLIASAAASVLVPGLVGASGSRPSGATMRERATRFLATLSPQQQRAATFEFDASARLAWNFMLGSYHAPGIALESLTDAQKDAARDLLETGVSRLGREKAENIMLQQDILRDEWGKGSPDRNSERFSVQIYGEPSATGAWSWRWEGHHLSLTFTLVDDEVVSTTPSSFSSEPNTVPSGPHQGLVVLKEEEVLGRALFSGLRGAARQAALLRESSPGNILSNRGAELRIAAEKGGIELGELKPSQAELAERLIEVYTAEVLPAPLRRQQERRLGAESAEAVRFGWAGADLDGSIYYRLTGASFLIEFATLRNQPLHLHAVFHDTRRNFGRHVV